MGRGFARPKPIVMITDHNPRPVTVSPVLILIMAALFSFSPSPGGAAETSEVQTLVTGNTAFALDLYGRLKAADGNLFLSPYSISTCLAMTYAGARGETAPEMARMLHFNPDQNQLNSAFGELQLHLNEARQKKGIELNVANGLWTQQGHPLLPAFLDTAQHYYEANLQQADFRTRAEPVRREINQWVSQKTKGKITDILPPGVVNPNTRLVLVNAIYFKGQWARQFNRSNTMDAPFWTARDQKTPAPLMKMTDNFNYAEADGLQLLELRYTGADLSMVVLLPREIDGLKGLEAMLDEPRLNRWLAQARERKVNVFLPRFKLTSQFALGATLAGMGMQAPFTSQADFSRIDGARDLFISAVIHKAFVDVNEEGTEAAAATGTVMSLTSAMRPNPTFRADHPFLFLIRDTRSGSILFLGRVADPGGK